MSVLPCDLSTGPIAYPAAGWDGDGDGRIESIATCTGSVVAPRWILSAAHCAFRPSSCRRKDESFAPRTPTP
jgi:V8-like Glu-specific endopeptidase